MLAGARAFLESIIDYAGLFPPAELPLAQAVASYLRYRRESASWMLGRFICPAARLKELAGFLEEITVSGTLRLAILGRGGKDVPEFLANLQRDLDDVFQLSQIFACSVESFEAKVPSALLGGSTADVAGFVGNVADKLESVRATPFFEWPILDAKAVDQVRAGLIQAGERRAGWKLRCGGLEPSAFPTPRQVAQVLLACCSAGVPWKATAGLHHPLRHFERGLNTFTHGFVNVFGAAILAHARLMTLAQIEEMLADEDAGHFAVDEGGFSWNSLWATTEEIRLARKHVVTSFGSCSFEEPCDDLRRLSWI